MPNHRVLLPEPTPELIRFYVLRFDQTQAAVEQALTKLFCFVPENTVLDEILLKVVALNALYGTGILALYRVAEHIHQLHIDPQLRVGDAEVVGRIARVQIGDKVRNNYSFATKYCAWHNPSAYPLYDRFVEQLLWGYRKQDHFDPFQRQALWEYGEFRRAILRFRDHYNLAGFSLKDIDKFLWLAGKEHYPGKGGQTPG